MGATILAVLAHAFFAVTQRVQTPTPPCLIAMTANEIQRLLAWFLDKIRRDIAPLPWSFLRGATRVPEERHEDRS